MLSHCALASASVMGLFPPVSVRFFHASASVSITPLAVLLVREEESDQLFGEVTIGVLSFLESNSKLPFFTLEESLEESEEISD